MLGLGVGGLNGNIGAGLRLEKIDGVAVEAELGGVGWSGVGWGGAGL